MEAKKELDISELRVGNYISIAGFIQRVNALSEDSDGCMIDTEKYHCFIGEPYNTPKPILITTDWMLNFGADMDLDSVVYINMNNCFMHFDRNDVHVRTGDNQDLMTKIKHVHEMQNLFFALTGEELELKDKSFLAAL